MSRYDIIAILNIMQYSAIYCNSLTSFQLQIFPNFKLCPQKETLSTSVLSKEIHFSVCSSHFNFIAAKWDRQADRLTNTYIIKDRYLASVYRYSIATKNITILCCIDFFFLFIRIRILRIRGFP